MSWAQPWPRSRQILGSCCSASRQEQHLRLAARSAVVLLSLLAARYLHWAPVSTLNLVVPLKHKLSLLMLRRAGGCSPTASCSSWSPGSGSRLLTAEARLAAADLGRQISAGPQPGCLAVDVLVPSYGEPLEVDRALLARLAWPSTIRSSRSGCWMDQWAATALQELAKQAWAAAISPVASPSTPRPATLNHALRSWQGIYRGVRCRRGASAGYFCGAA